MSFLPVADYKFKALTDISPEFLKNAGISLLLLDLDNTVSPYKNDVATDALLAWTERMKASSIRLFIVSNSKKKRPGIFAAAMGIPFIDRAGKPSRRGLAAAMGKAGAEKSETALVGDQIYTDMLAAKRFGITGILVEPIKFTNPFLAIRYGAEMPFRIFGKKC